MDYSVGKISGTLKVDRDTGGSDRERKKGRHSRRGDKDTVSISAEARERCASDDQEVILSDAEETEKSLLR
ncbi:MAG: hypothetical protein FD174_2055 [Geobacteraceae bacterium]|nr:MAG: hypothetical protein FD174_2055 [Geobacteraceae bacterium]